VESYALLLLCSFFLGIGLASFSAAAGLASGWYPANRQGSALGIFGMGSFGQSLASLGAPVVAAAMGYRWGFWFFALLAFLWLIAFYVLAENPKKKSPGAKPPALLPLLKQGMTWILCCFYFLTFGGLVAMAVYLPT